MPAELGDDWPSRADRSKAKPCSTRSGLGGGGKQDATTADNGSVALWVLGASLRGELDRMIMTDNPVDRMR